MGIGDQQNFGFKDPLETLIGCGLSRELAQRICEPYRYVCTTTFACWVYAPTLMLKPPFCFTTDEAHQVLSAISRKPTSTRPSKFSALIGSLRDPCGPSTEDPGGGGDGGTALGALLSRFPGRHVSGKSDRASIFIENAGTVAGCWAGGFNVRGRF